MVFWIFFAAFFVIGIVGLYCRELLAGVFSLLLALGMGTFAFVCWSHGIKSFQSISELSRGTYCVEGTSLFGVVLKYQENGVEYTGYLTQSEYILHGLLTDCFFLDEKKKVHPVEGRQE